MTVVNDYSQCVYREVSAALINFPEYSSKFSSLSLCNCSCYLENNGLLV
jgi:hypothetical protein